MTDLLILLWLGDVSSKVSGLLALGAAACAAWVFLLVKFRQINTGDLVLCRLSIKLVCACVAASLISSLIPSWQWFYIAAGGTAAVKALDSELGQKVAKLVEQKVDAALGEVKK